MLLTFRGYRYAPERTASEASAFACSSSSFATSLTLSDMMLTSYNRYKRWRLLRWVSRRVSLSSTSVFGGVDSTTRPTSSSHHTKHLARGWNEQTPHRDCKLNSSYDTHNNYKMHIFL